MEWAALLRWAGETGSRAAVKRMVITSAARQAAEVLAEEILAHEGGEAEWALGSEGSLMELLGVGRPTLRQAARLLEQQQLLVVRRGINGGFFGHRPSVDGVTANASVFLRSQCSTIGQLLQAALLLGTESAALAAANDNAADRDSLMAYYGEWLQDGADIPIRRFMELAPGFQREVARLSSSPVLYLFVSVLMDLATSAGGIARAYEDPERRRTTAERHMSIAEAISEGNPSLAAMRMQQHLESIIDWTDEHTLGQTLNRHVQ